MKCPGGHFVGRRAIAWRARRGGKIAEATRSPASPVEKIRHSVMALSLCPSTVHIDTSSNELRHTVNKYSIVIHGDMYFRISPLRHCGRKLSWREVRNGPSFSGDLITFIREVKGELIVVATVTNTESPAARACLPDLYQPVLVWVTPLAMRLRGFERCEKEEGVFSVVQEWHCEVP